MIDIIGVEHRACELGEKIVLFVSRAIRSDYANRAAAIPIADSSKLATNQLKSIFPCRRRQLAVPANERLRQALLVMHKVKSVATFHAEEIAVDPALVTIVAAHDLRPGITTAHTERRLASIPAVGADRADVVHFPRPGLVAIRSRRECADWADVDAHTTLFAVEMVFLVGRDDRTHGAVLNAERPNVHAFAAHPHAPIAQNAARPVEIHYRRPLLFFFVVLGLHEFRFSGAVGKSHILQFAFAAGIANRAIQRMIAEEQLHHRLARLTHFIAIGGNDHALGHDRGAGGLELGHLFDLDHAHAASAL